MDDLGQPKQPPKHAMKKIHPSTSALPSGVTLNQNNSSSIPISKKSSPMKHVTPIIKKYDCQRQAKNGKSVKLKSQAKKVNEECSVKNLTPVQGLVAGMDSLDAALRRAEKCLAGGHTDTSSEHPIESNADDLGDVDEEGVSPISVPINQQISGSVRSSQLRSRNRGLKKRNQLQKDLEHALPLAGPDQTSESEERCFGYAAAFFKKVRDRFEEQNSSLFNKFSKLLDDFGTKIMNVTDLYHHLMILFEGHPDLCEEFLGFLLPWQALQCGKFMEHLAFMEMSSFLRKLEFSFSKQPQHLRKVHANWARLAEDKELNLDTVRSTILPLLRGNAVLVDSFLELFPSGKPPESKMTDFDQLKCEDMDSEHSGEEETYERVEVPPENDDPFGGENCQCCCHDSSADIAFCNRTKHCVPCGIRFISGKVFMQTGHGLRPVRIDFSGGGNNTINIKRLNADHQKLSRPRSRRGRVNTPQTSSKTEDIKPPVETDDEATFSSKNKSPRQRSKITRQTREKPLSARSLLLNKTGCHRKTSVSKSSSSTVVHNNEALPSLSPCGPDVPSTQDFSRVPNVSQMDQDHFEKQDLEENVNEETELKIEEMEEQMVIDKDALKDDVRPESVVVEETKEELKGGNENVEMNLKDKLSEVSDDKDDVVEVENMESSNDVCGASSDTDVEVSSEDGGGATWTREEDRIILCTFQSEPDKDKTIQKIGTQLPHRTIDEISSRFLCLMNLIQQMT